MNTKTSFRLLLLLGILITGFTACKPDKVDKTAITKETVAGSYKITRMTLKSGTDPEEDLLSQMEDCQRDNVVTFSSNGSYANNDVGIICNPPGGDNGFWDLPNSTTFRLDGIDMTIKSFTTAAMNLTWTDNSDVYNYTFTRQ